MCVTERGLAAGSAQGTMCAAQAEVVKRGTLPAGWVLIREKLWDGGHCLSAFCPNCTRHHVHKAPCAQGTMCDSELLRAKIGGEKCPVKDSG
jgi:hypothetical protein